jgi:hypothetical protein
MFKRLARCRRGSVAMILSISLVPLLALAGLGTEAGMWYSVRRAAQNAADTAAYSGALWVASPDAQTLGYRGKEFAAQNGFCTTGDRTAYPGSICGTLLAGTTQNVRITRGTWSAGTFTAGAGGNAVQAIVSQSQPPLLASLFLTSNVTIAAQAIAVVNPVSNPCVLALTGTISFQGSPTVNAPGCGLASNDTAAGAINFTGGGGINIANVGSISAAGSCTGTTAQCANVLTYMPPVTNPLSGLDAYMSSLTISTNCTGSQPVAYTTATKCVNKNFNFGNSTYLLSGVYFFSGNVKLNGNTVLCGSPSAPTAKCSNTATTTGVTIILLPGASLTISGNPAIYLKAQTTVPTSELPTSLQPAANLLSDLLIYDPESGNVKITGDSTSFFNGAMYFPNATVNFQGNATPTTCTELIAASVQLQGNPTFGNSGCPASITPTAQVVMLVQ